MSAKRAIISSKSVRHPKIGMVMYAELTRWKIVRSMDKKPCDNILMYTKDLNYQTETMLNLTGLLKTLSHGTQTNTGPYWSIISMVDLTGQ